MKRINGRQSFACEFECSHSRPLKVSEKLTTAGGATIRIADLMQKIIFLRGLLRRLKLHKLVGAFLI